MSEIPVYKIAVVEDDEYYNLVQARFVESLCNKNTFPDLKFEIKSYFDAVSILNDIDPDLNLMILDFHLSDSKDETLLNGENVLAEVLKVAPKCKVVMSTSQKNILKNKQLMAMGAYEYIDKNFDTGKRTKEIIQGIVAESSKYSGEPISTDVQPVKSTRPQAKIELEKKGLLGRIFGSKKS